MNEFRVFNVDKKKDFLAKAKSNKHKKQQDNKRTTQLLLIQKCIRAYLTSVRYASTQYPLLIRSPIQIQTNRRYVEGVWDSFEKHPNIIKKKVLNLTIKSLELEIPIQVKMTHFMASIDSLVVHGNSIIKVKHFQFLIQHYFSDLCQNGLIKKLSKFEGFTQALQGYIGNDIHRLIWVIDQVKDFGRINGLIEQFTKQPRKQSQLDLLRQPESLQDIQYSYTRVLKLLHLAVEHNENDNWIATCLSMAIMRLKYKTVQFILKTYNIDKQLYLSSDLQEEVDEIFQEKKEWKEFQNYILPLAELLGHFLSKFYKYSSHQIEPILKIVIQISKLHQSFAALKLEPQQFFNLVQKLDSKFCLSRQQQDLKINQVFFIVLILKNYLQSINDIQFHQSFKFSSDILKRSIKGYLIKLMKNICMLTVKNSQIVQELINNSVVFMSNLYNKVFRTKLLPTTVFQDSSLVLLASSQNWKSYGNVSYFNQLKKIVERMPCLLPIQTRFFMFRILVASQRGGGHHGQKLRIRRGHQFEDAFKKLYNTNMMGSLHVQFINQHGIEQQGIDAGGLTKEFLIRVFRVAFSPKNELFIENENKELMPNPCYKDVQNGSTKAKYFEFIGQLLGKSLHENIMLGVKFAGPFLNLLISKKNTFDDLEAIDHDLCRSLSYIATMETGVDDLGLTFRYEDNITKDIIDLIPRGNKYLVNDRNKMQYINLLINYKVNKSFERQTWFIRKGLKRVINQKWIQMFNYAELNYLISGTGSIDVKDWRNHTHFASNQVNQDYINCFWEVVTQMSEEQKSLLLKFVTSCERPSFLGFKDIQPPFSIHIQANKEELPVAHTCSNLLRLPRYPSKEILKKKLLYAIKSEAGFQFA